MPLCKKELKLRYFIKFAYNGKNYFGFQIQPNAISIQETLDKSLSLLLKQKIEIVGAGRTDSGVHAKNIYAHFTDTIKERRKGRITQTDDIIFNGEFWTGQKALDYGLIDGIDDLYSFIYKRYGKEVKIEYIEQQQSWFKRKFGMAQIAQEITDTALSRIEEGLLTSKIDLH